MTYRDSTKLEQLLFIYNLKMSDVSKHINANINSVKSVIKGTSPSPNKELLIKLSDFLGVSLNLILKDSDDNAILIKHFRLVYPIYISFGEYLILRLRGDIEDRLEDGTLSHYITSRGLFMIVNIISETKELYIKDLHCANPLDRLIKDTKNKSYLKKKHFEYQKSVIKEFIKDHHLQQDAILRLALSMQTIDEDYHSDIDEYFDSF